MMLSTTVTPVTDREAWDKALTRLPNPQALQSWDWGDFKSRWGWQPARLLWSTEAGLPLAAAQILRRPIPKTPWSMLYLPRGPVLDYQNLPLLDQVLKAIEAYGRREKALFLKIDPDVSIGAGDTEMVADHDGQAVKRLLLEHGWQYAAQQIQFKNTVVLELTPAPEALLAAMKSKWRYNIRLAGRKGVTVTAGTLADLEVFYEMYALTSQRDNFLIRPKAYYLDLWRHYLQLTPKRARLLLAYVDHTPVAGLILFYFHKTAWYMYGASTGQHRNLMPNHLLQWEAIKGAKAAGCSRYDMWGAPDSFGESDPMWGVYRFKAGFGGVTRQGLGAFDYPIQPLKYRLYNRLLPTLLSLWRRY